MPDNLRLPLDGAADVVDYPVILKLPRCAIRFMESQSKTIPPSYLIEEAMLNQILNNPMSAVLMLACYAESEGKKKNEMDSVS